MIEDYINRRILFCHTKKMFPIIIFLPQLLSALLSDEPVTGPQWDSWKRQQGLVTEQATTRYTYKYNLPEYSQYKEFIKSVRPTTTIAPEMLTSEALESENPIVNAPVILGNNPLCKQAPESGDIYGHISCLLTYTLYILAIVAIGIYLWKKWKSPQQQPQEHEGIEMNLLVDTLKENGFPSNRKNSRDKPGNLSVV